MSRAAALVFGASSGIGLATVDALKHRGHVVAGLSRRACDVADASFPCDVTDDVSVRTAVRQAEERHGPPDVAVYASGVGVMGKTLDIPQRDARATFEVNFWGMDRAVRAVLPGMCARRRGTIVLVSSIVALRPVPHEAFYAASKAAAARYAGCLAFEAAASRVRVQMLHVGYVDTGFSQRAGWFGMHAPSRSGSGTNAAEVGEAICELVARGSLSGVFGWKERVIALGDRVAPHLYDRCLTLRGAGR